MAETTVSQSIDRKAGRWPLFKEMLAEMDRLHAQMKQDRVEINRLKLETRANLAEIKATLDRISAA